MKILESVALEAMNEYDLKFLKNDKLPSCFKLSYRLQVLDCISSKSNIRPEPFQCIYKILYDVYENKLCEYETITHIQLLMFILYEFSKGNRKIDYSKFKKDFTITSTSDGINSKKIDNLIDSWGTL